MSRIKAIVCGLALLMTGCEHPSPMVSKKIVAKQTALVRTLSGDTNETEFYLIAEDGTYLSVSVGWYATQEIGVTVTNDHWRK